jgi:putative membrane-bound dehydrogenase-like protein
VPNLPYRTAAATIVALALLAGRLAADVAAPAAPQDLSRELPRIPPTEPADSVATFRVADGLKVELVAAEPLVTDPCDVAWDEEGRLYVCELWNYPGEPKAGEPLGRVRLLQSSKGDARYDSATIFADGLKWPGGVACYDGGVFVASSPDILYLKDTDGDGKADVRERVFTGFAGRTYEVANCLRWGPDNKIYVCGSYAGGTVSRVGPDGKPAGEGIRSRDFRFDPRTRTIEAVSGGGEFGQSFDDWGERFTCDATHFVWHPVLPRDVLDRSPHLSVTTVQEMSIPEWTQVYPVSQPEPWKAARQKFWDRWVNSNSDMRAGRFPKTELAPHGYATSAAGITVYRGSALGEDYRNDAFVAEPANNVVVRLKLKPDGVGVRAGRPPRDAGHQREFLASTDNWFRPVNLANGPDGCLYVVAMYREIIEDESAIPDDILKHYDLYSGRERGRILRIAPQAFAAPPTPKLGTASPAELVQALDHPDAWRRETAQRLLVQRRDRSAVEPLRKLVSAAKTPQGRIHALWTLKGLAALDESAVSPALDDPDAHVREAALKALADLPDVVAALGPKAALTRDPEIRVRFRAALVCAAVERQAAVPLLAQAAQADANDPWMRVAIIAGAGDGAAELFGTLITNGEFVARREGATELLAGLAGVVGSRGSNGEVGMVLGDALGDALAGRDDARRAIVRSLADGLARWGTSLADMFAKPGADGKLAPVVASLFDDARAAATDRKANERRRADAVALLAHAPFAAYGDALTALLDPREPTAVQIAAARALGAHSDPGVGPALVSRWRTLGPSVRPAVLDALFRRPERAGALLDALKRKDIATTDIDPARRTMLLEHPDEKLRARAAALFQGVRPSDKVELVARYAREVADLPGDADRGQQVFRATCAACHQPERGPRLGPNLATLQDRSPGTLLNAILDPNRDVKPGFVSYVIRTTDGQDFAGVVTAETAASVTLRQAAGVEEAIPRKNIRLMKSSGLSMMPEGLEAGIPPRQMADLLRFLQALKAE